MLSDSYENHLAASGLGSGQGGGSEVGYSAFDFHARSRTGGIESVKRQLEGVVGFVGENFGATLVEIGESGQEKLITKQKGVFRTNCKGVSCRPFFKSLSDFHLAIFRLFGQN